MTRPCPFGRAWSPFRGDPPFDMKPFFERRKGDTFDLALLSLGAHLGIYMDPPAHYLDGGATVDHVPLETLVGPGIILDMCGRREIDGKALEEMFSDDRNEKGSPK